MVGVTVPRVEIAAPVTYGTYEPTRSEAVCLSVAVIMGRFKISNRPCVFSARISRLKLSLEAENTKPPTLAVGDTRPTPRLLIPWKPTRPGPTTGLLPSAAVLLKAKPGCADGLIELVIV